MTRAALHQLVDEVSDSQIDRIAELVRAVNANDRVGIQLALAPEVEPELDEIAKDEDRQNAEPIDQVCSAEEWG
ncbi:MAG TPA: hypothetical protein VGZ00_05525 [Candidatus Baltobacteraceae bacterium]|jgi:hypothetical protein|nr:hypothetical protein [Candidatus Baltobacteraceae bacterium]